MPTTKNISEPGNQSGEETVRPFVTLRPGRKGYEIQEAFKTLRTNIDFSGENIKAVCITSALPGDGKSTVSYHLARAFAESGRRTLLLDADLRKSVMRKMACEDGDPGQGLTYYLAGRRRYEETVCTTNLQTLDIIFSGQFPPNPSELLGTRRFANLIERAKKEYAVIIIDTPPIGSVIDAAVVARVCDGAGHARLTQRNRFFPGDALELVMPGAEPLAFIAGEIRDGEGAPVAAASHPKMELRMALPVPAPAGSFLRKRRTEERSGHGIG